MLLNTVVSASIVIFGFGLAKSQQLMSIATVPEYAIAYAPVVHLHSEEVYLPSDLATHLMHTIPKTNNITIPGFYNLTNLDELGSDVYLTSSEGILALPTWFEGGFGKTGAMISVDKEDFVDVFYFYFFSYNQGNTVRAVGEFGDHVGDWEYAMIRFQNATPQSIWLSQHNSGEAFTYDCMEKEGLRPVVYAGNGTHALWATPGDHDHTFPVTLPDDGLITDYTDRGPIFEMDLYSYTWNGTFVGDGPIGWLNFEGRWGDEQLRGDGQKEVFGQYKYVSGPTGPKDKGLDRKNVCPDSVEVCIVRESLTP